VADFYTSISATASNLINKFGKEIAIHREKGGTFDGGSGEETGATTDIQTLNAVVLPASGGKIAALDKRYGLAGLVYKKLNWCVISGNDLLFEPEPGQKVVINTESWEIVGVTELNPNSGDPITYEMAFTI